MSFLCALLCLPSDKSPDHFLKCLFQTQSAVEVCRKLPGVIYFRCHGTKWISVERRQSQSVNLGLFHEYLINEWLGAKKKKEQHWWRGLHSMKAISLHHLTRALGILLNSSTTVETAICSVEPARTFHAAQWERWRVLQHCKCHCYRNSSVFLVDYFSCLMTFTSTKETTVFVCYQKDYLWHKRNFFIPPFLKKLSLVIASQYNSTVHLSVVFFSHSHLFVGVAVLCKRSDLRNFSQCEGTGA